MEVTTRYVISLAAWLANNFLCWLICLLNKSGCESSAGYLNHYSYLNWSMRERFQGLSYLDNMNIFVWTWRLLKQNMKHQSKWNFHVDYWTIHLINTSYLPHLHSSMDYISSQSFEKIHMIWKYLPSMDDTIYLVKSQTLLVFGDIIISNILCCNLHNMTCILACTSYHPTYSEYLLFIVTVVY